MKEAGTTGKEHALHPFSSLQPAFCPLPQHTPMESEELRVMTNAIRLIKTGCSTNIRIREILEF